MEYLLNEQEEVKKDKDSTKNRQKNQTNSNIQSKKRTRNYKFELTMQGYNIIHFEFISE